MDTELDSAICVGILAYADDDVSLLSPIATFYGMWKMLFLVCRKWVAFQHQKESLQCMSRIDVHQCLT